MSNKESVKVGVRIRPLNSREKNMNSEVVVSNEGNKLCIKDGDKSKQFIFDYVFGLDTQQKTIYDNSVYSLVQNALQGYNGTIFAYGQTGAGKTFTMMGDYTDPQIKGIIPRTFDHVMVAIKTSEDKKFVLRTSFIEIYNEEILDLLEENKDKYKKTLRENPQVGVYIHQLKQVPVKSIAEMFQVLDLGNKHRTVGATLMNATSSRSHALFTIHIESLEGEDRVKSSKVNLVDLAGSQRQSKTEATGERLKEGAKINLSLTALGNVINALVEGKKGGHIPYRDSKLTRLLQNSLGGNTKTLMIASVSPAAFNYDETVSTLRYAARARNIKNTPKVNQDAKDTMIRQYYQQIQRLKKQLQLGGGCYIENKTGQESVNISQMEQQVSEKDKKLSQKEQQLLETKNRLKQMEQLMLKKGDGNEKLVKQRMVKKKFIKKQQQLAKNNIKALEDQDQGLLLENKQMSDTKIQEQLLHYKQLSKKLRKKLKSTINDKSDRQKQFQDQREDLNRTIRSLEQDLSFYHQISQKFLSLSDLTAIRDSSTLDIQKRQFTIRPFLLHDQKVTLPKSLQQNEVDDLWKERRKGLKMEFMTSQKPPQGFIDKFQGTTNFSKTATEFMTNRGLIEKYKFDDPIYQEKQYGFEDAQRVIFRKTNNIRIASRSRSRSTSKNKILQGMKKQQSLEKNSSITKVKLQPLRK